jgi:hypothetical protein
MNRILLWLQQPTSVAGVSALVGTVSALMLHQITLAQALPLLAGAAASIALPDNTAAPSQAAGLVRAVAAEVSLSGEKQA